MNLSFLTWCGAVNYHRVTENKCSFCCTSVTVEKNIEREDRQKIEDEKMKMKTTSTEKFIYRITARPAIYTKIWKFEICLTSKINSADIYLSSVTDTVQQHRVYSSNVSLSRRCESSWYSVACGSASSFHSLLSDNLSGWILIVSLWLDVRGLTTLDVAVSSR